MSERREPASVVAEAATTKAPHQALRILHLLRALHPESGGPLTHLESAVRLLDERAFQMQIGTLEACAPPSTVPAPLHTGRAGTSRLRNAPAFVSWLRRALREADVVQLHGVFGWHFVLGAAACRLAGVPYLVRPHGSLSPWFLAQGAFKKRLYLRSIGLSMLRRAHGVIAMTPMEADSFRELDARIPAVRIYPGVETPSRSAEGGASDPLRIAFLGRIAPLKNMPDLLRAIAEIHSRGYRVALDVVGDGPAEYPDAMRQLAARLGISGRVHFAGPLWGDEKDAVLCSAQVLALPSNYENFSHVTAEALALGLPVVISDMVALAPLVERYRCGRVVRLGDVDALADALLEFADQDRRREASQAARQCARECLSLETMRDSLEALYRTAAEAGAPAGTDGS